MMIWSYLLLVKRFTKNAILKIIKITIDDLNIALWYTNNIQVSIANHKV